MTLGHTQSPVPMGRAVPACIPQQGRCLAPIQPSYQTLVLLG